jgi:hypothetical protein
MGPDEFGEGDVPSEDTAAAEIPPLSLFFPSISEEEARLIDGETAKIAERRARVMDLWRRGRSVRFIKDTLGCSVGTVHRDIHQVLEGYRRITLRTVAEKMADELQRLAHREAELEIDLERSRGDFTETTTSRRNGKTAGDSAVVKKRQRFGDPAIHSLLLQCWDRRCRLLGLFKSVDMQGVETPPVKLVAGLDPVEAV